MGHPGTSPNGESASPPSTPRVAVGRRGGNRRPLRGVKHAHTRGQDRSSRWRQGRNKGDRREASNTADIQTNTAARHDNWLEDCDSSEKCTVSRRKWLTCRAPAHPFRPAAAPHPNGMSADCNGTACTPDRRIATGRAATCHYTRPCPTTHRYEAHGSVRHAPIKRPPQRKPHTKRTPA